MEVKFAMHHIRGSSETSGRRRGKLDLYSEENQSWQAWSTYVKRLGEKQEGLVLMSKSGKDACGCRIVVLWGCSVYGSDMGLRQRISVSAP